MPWKYHSLGGIYMGNLYLIMFHLCLLYVYSKLELVTNQPQSAFIGSQSQVWCDTKWLEKDIYEK